MTRDEVAWVLDQWASVVQGVSEDYRTDVYRIDRDRSVIYESSRSVDMSRPTHKQTNDLQRGVYAGARFVDRDTEVRGPGYNQNVDAVVGCRIVGMTHREHGYIDPEGNDGVPFDVLVRRCRNALWDAAATASNNGELLGINSPDGKYYTLDITNEADVSADWADFFRYDFDLLLVGEKDH